ncbi:hypothetical protein D3C73_1298620 [compost metagenome]
MICTGKLAPPETAMRRFLRNRARSAVSSSAFSNAQYMVGTPAKKVMACFCISAMACFASKRGTMTNVAARAKPAFICTVEPKVWNSGNVTKWRSGFSNELLNNCTEPSAFSTRLEWVSSAPLARPVVPLV